MNRENKDLEDRGNFPESGVSKGGVPSEEEVREYFQRGYYIRPKRNEEGDQVAGIDYLGPILPKDKDDGN